ncbi:MAG: acyl-CoA desaturase [Taibaiella sp.]|nr:acyl-CoA desaturase [Taibaiella sp.]
MITPKFHVPQVSIHSEMKKRINDFFETNKISPTGNAHLYFKAGILVASYIAIYIHLLWFTPGVWAAIGECLLLGLITAGIGFNVMHDGAHGSFSKSSKLNTVAAFSIDVLGASSFMWNTKHNIIHHAFTNIEGVDDDVEAGMLLRMAPKQKQYGFHKYQYIYFWALYALLYIVWIFYNDYKKYFSKKIGDVPLKKLKRKDHILFWAFKAFHIVMFVALPIYMLGFFWWIAGFAIYTATTGVILSLVFQLAHILEETSFPEAMQPSNRLEDEWALHQLKTTANFATKNKFVTWWVGGLNFQIEHHLFPRISHVHYPQINAIIRQVCQEMGAPYIEHPNLQSAIGSHITHLKNMGVA